MRGCIDIVECNSEVCSFLVLNAGRTLFVWTPLGILMLSSIDQHFVNQSYHSGFVSTHLRCSKHLAALIPCKAGPDERVTEFLLSTGFEGHI